MTQGEQSQKSRVLSWLVVATVTTVALQPMQGYTVHYIWTHSFAMTAIPSKIGEKQRNWEVVRRHIREELQYQWAAMAAAMSLCLGVLWTRHRMHSRLPYGHSSRIILNVLSIIAFLVWIILAGFISFYFVSIVHYRIVSGW